VCRVREQGATSVDARRGPAHSIRIGERQRRTPRSQPLPTHSLRLYPDQFCLMSQDLATVLERVREAVREAHIDFRSLCAAVNRDSIPASLSVAGSALDKLTQHLDLIATSTAALSSNYVRELFGTRMTADVKFSDAIMRDMDAVASCLRLMMPLDSSKTVMAIEERQCRDVAEMVDRYDRIISSALIHHNMCVRSSTAISIHYSLLHRSFLDVLVNGTRSLLGEMEDIRDRLREQQESAVDEIRDSKRSRCILESAPLLNVTYRGSQETTSCLFRKVQLERCTTRMSRRDT
jgi:hypothetical protein